MNYRKVNNLVGWIIGVIASIVYLKTMEPTVSFWDCGEFLSCAYKLEVGHSPGAPFFMMLQRIFGLLAGGGAVTGVGSANAAIFINSFSALMSGMTILFLFWTITHLAKKLVAPGDDAPTSNQVMLIMGTGIIGGLAYTFSDTFWFSAVEAEVYATSSFFTALVFWAILKWENVANNKYADRWLIFIAYMIGLSVGVHLLNLLTIPAIAMVYYFKRYDATKMGTVIAFVAGCVLLAFVQFGVIQYLPIFASKLDLLFVNSFGLPFDIGALVGMLIVVGILIWLLFFAKRKGWYLVHTAVLCVMFIVIGFSSYLAPMIRSRADVAIDMTNPDNVLSLVSYVQREQYGAQPLLYGQDFDSKIVDVDTKGYTYTKSKKNGKDYYEQTGKRLDYKFEPDKMRFFPRIYENNEQGHVRFYRQYLGLGPDDRPTSADNMKYFFGYQMGWMWWRYFMWNYAGRQNDVEGQGDARNGNWVSGIKFLDKMHVGDMDVAGDGVGNNPARNELYFLPLILGILGLIYQFNRDKKDGIITFVLFFFTGIAIGIYLNMPPLQPRERDYAFAGSTYTFAIWIGLGVLMVNQWLQKVIKGNAGSIFTVLLCLVLVPALMAKVEWHDHDRSQKYLARTTAVNVLNSCAPNAVLFTFGDNDTYPVWYAQEVEGVRPDVRIINMSLLGIDWYIDQLNYKINKADALPMIWKKQDYQGDNHNYVFYYNNPQIPQGQYINLKDICSFMISNNQDNKLQTQGGAYENYMPTKSFFISTPSKEQMVKDGLISAADTGRISTEVKFTFPKAAAYKDDIAVLNIIAGMASDGWKRPIYFGGGLPGDNYVGLDEYLKLEGVVYRLMPYKYTDSVRQNRGGEKGFVDIDKSYNLFMNVYQWGGSERNDVYFDEKNRLMFQAYRINSSLRLSDGLNALGRKEDAIKVLDKVDKSLSQAAYPYNPYTLEGFDASGYFYAMSYYNIGAKGIPGGSRVAHQLVKNLEGDINWILTLSDDKKEDLSQDAQKDLGMIHSMGVIAGQAGDSATAKEMDAKVKVLEQKMMAGLNIQGQR